MGQTTESIHSSGFSESPARHRDVPSAAYRDGSRRGNPNSRNELRGLRGPLNVSDPGREDRELVKEIAKESHALRGPSLSFSNPTETRPRNGLGNRPRPRPRQPPPHDSKRKASRPTGGESFGTKRWPSVEVTSTTISLRPARAASRRSNSSGGPRRSPRSLAFTTARAG